MEARADGAPVSKGRLWTGRILSALAVLFFVSGADANTYVLGMLTTHGSIRPRTPILLLWGAVTGALAIILLLSGGLGALQQTVIVASAPFLVVIVGVVVSFLRDLRTEPDPTVCRHHDLTEVPAGAEPPRSG